MKVQITPNAQWCSGPYAYRRGLKRSRKHPRAINAQVPHTIIEGAGCVNGGDKRLIGRNSWRQVGVVRESGKALRVDGQRLGERENGELSTFTALIQSDRSLVESALHSRRTLGFWQELLPAATTVDTTMERRRTRTRPRKEAICKEGRDGEEGKNVCTPFMLLASPEEEINK